MNDLQIKSSASFQEAYRLLNSNQKQATDTLEGPVMVIAGPGTGKTQILTIRIGNILLRTQVDPKNILCLTYTEAGATAMRKRLVSFIGPQAYDVAIHTFHSFCNKVIRENSEKFNLFGEFDAVGDLEKKQILREITSEISKDSVLFNYQGYYDNLVYDLESLFADIKKENWKPLDMIKEIDLYIEEMKGDEKYIYKRAGKDFKKGDFKAKDYAEDKRKYERTKAGIGLFFEYEKKLAGRFRYDYEDMIRWTLERFQKDDVLLGRYQEQFQYILVDEFQDTNGAQNAILECLLSFWDHPNIFVVGDDDQAIFRFQGANVKNMLEFYIKYQPEVFVLTHNYRSTQSILDNSGAVIQNNIERLIRVKTELSKDLISSGPNIAQNIHPKVTEYLNPIAEITGVCVQVDQWIKEGVPPKEIALLYRKNADADPYVKILQQKNIPFSVSKAVSVLDEPFIKHIINFLHYFAKHEKKAFSQDDILYTMLLAPFIPLDTVDLNRISWWMQEERRLRKENFDTEPKPEYGLRLTLANAEQLKRFGVEQVEACTNFVASLGKAEESCQELTVQNFVERIMVDFGILDYILHQEERNYLLQLLNSFYELIKKETAAHSSWAVLDVVNMIEDMQNNKIPLIMEYILGNVNGVQLSTIYKSKGLEYANVILIKCSENEWKGSKRNGFVLIPQYIQENSDQKEDDRRLFFVGMTRAKQHLQISYSIFDHRQKGRLPLSFINELLVPDQCEFVKASISESEVVENIIVTLSPWKKDYSALDDSFFSKYMERFTLNMTAFNKYLDCPLAFYYENVLRVPMARKASLGFGNAVHQTLDLYLKNPQNRTELRPLVLEQIFTKAMERFRSHFTAREFEDFTHQGSIILPAFIQSQIPLFALNADPLFEEPIHGEILGVPVTGKMDRVDITPVQLKVVDYKTGKPNANKKVIAPNENLPYGSEYWIQMMFYILLIRQKPQFRSKAISSAFYFVNPDNRGEFVKHEMQANESQLEFVSGLIKEVYDKISKKIFTPGCGKPECMWCSYIDTGRELVLEEETETYGEME